MNLSDLTSLADMDLAALSDLLRRTSLSNVDEEDHKDPVIAILMRRIDELMHSNCMMLAFRLRHDHGFEVVVLEGRRAGDVEWSMVHVAACRSSVEAIETAVRDGRALSLDVLDAIGGGQMSDRTAMYGALNEYRVVHAGPEGATYLGGVEGHPDVLAGDDPIATLPCLAHAMDYEFHLDKALRSILKGIDRLDLPGIARCPSHHDLFEILVRETQDPTHRIGLSC